MPERSWLSRDRGSNIYVRACLRMGDGRQLDARITERLPHGCKIITGEMLTVGEVVELEVVGSDTIRAKINWALADRAGLLFV